MMINLMQLARKIHRILVLIISVLGIVMGVTGIFLKYTSWVMIFGFDLGLMRSLHNNLSPFLSIILMFMIVTGLILYFVPILLKRSLQKKN
jgi:hypothetical protein